MATPPLDGLAMSITSGRLSRRSALGRLGRGGIVATALTALSGQARHVAADDASEDQPADETHSTSGVDSGDVIVPAAAHDDLPAFSPETTGRLRRLSDYDRGLWLETNDQWLSLRGEMFDVRAYGATGDGASDDWDAFTTAIEAMTTRLETDSTSAYGRTLLVPPGSYRLAQTLVIDRAIRLLGASGAGPGTDSILQFDEGIVGVLITALDPALTGQTGRRGDGAIIERLRIVAAPPPPDARGTKVGSAKSTPVAVDPAGIHGVWLRTEAILRDVCVEGFDGDGIHIEIAAAARRSEGDSTVAAGSPSWEVSSCWVAGCGGSGLVVQGPGGGLAELVTTTGNGGWGIRDDSDGTAYLRCQATGNAAGPFTSVGADNRSLFAACVATAGQSRAVYDDRTLVVGGIYGNGFQGGNAWTANAARMYLQAQAPGSGDTALPTAPTLHIRGAQGQTEPHVRIGDRRGGRLVEVDAAGRLLVGPADLTPSPAGGDQAGAQPVQVQISSSESGQAALRWVVSGESTAWVAQARAYREAGGTDANPTAGGSRLTFQTPGATDQELDTLTLRDGQVGIGTLTPSPAAVLDVASSTQGFLPPRLTSEQRDAITGPPEGLTIFNVTTKRLNVHDSESWREVAFTEPVVGG